MFRILITAIVLAGLPGIASSAPPSEASIREILTVTNAQKLVEGMFNQIDGMMKNSMQQAVGRPLTVDEQKMADTLNSKVMVMMREELSWETLEPMYLRIYQQSFTQEEVDGMLAFYKSPAGEALIKKLPLVMQQSMSAVQERMGPLMQKVQATVKETVAEIMSSKKN